MNLDGVRSKDATRNTRIISAGVSRAELAELLPVIERRAREQVFEAIKHGGQPARLTSDTGKDPMKQLEHKSFAIRELKLTGDEGTIEGYGSVYGNVDSQRDMVLPGAFAKSLDRLRAAGQKPKMLWQHKSDMPIGVWDEMTETPQGLYLKGRISTATAAGRDAYALLKDGAIDGLSIGYGVRDYAIDAKNGCRLLKQLDLYEVSLVTFPANELATVTQVKSAGGDIDTAVSLLANAATLCETGAASDIPMSPEMCASVCQMIGAAIALLDDPDEADDDTANITDTAEARGGEGKARPQTIRQFEKYLRDGGFSQKDATTVALHGFKALTTQGEPDQEVNHAAEKLAALFNQFKA